MDIYRRRSERGGWSRLLRINGLSFLIVSAPSGYAFEGKTEMGDQIRVIISEREASDIVTITASVKTERKTATE